tara:strand:+ start:703 stop:1383 length:681 start_codon:yes stop_codon:yes gene_type:complete
MITKTFEYPVLKRVEIESARYYLDSLGNPVPSVTTVLSKTSNKSDGIDQWRARVGYEEAERIIKLSTDIGSAVHEAIENYLNNTLWDKFEDSLDQKIAKKISQKFIKDGLNDISEIWGLEVGLILDNLYAGTADCVGIYKDKESIIDFKTAKKIKKREWIEDYFLQCCAYANAHNVMFNTKIEQLVILMVDRDLIFKEFLVKPIEFKTLTGKWKSRLIKFNKEKKI